MPIIRNPFRRPNGETPSVERNEPENQQQALQTKPVDMNESVEYKLSEISDNGVYLPPSPTESKSFWSTRSTTSTATSNHRSVLNENEPFNISRESFDSYRRSFDICARSPMPEVIATPPRQSLDSRRMYQPRYPFSGTPRQSIDKAEPQVIDEDFEEVGLNDENKPQSKRRSLFARFGGDNDTPVPNKEGDTSRPTSSHMHFGMHFTGRKRGQSGQGSELRSMGKPMTESHLPAEVRVDS